jgi:hypothetical protein
LGDLATGPRAADFYVFSSLVSLDYHMPNFVRHLKRLPIKCTSYHLIALPARIRSQGRSFIAVISVQTWHTSIRQSRAAAPNVSQGVHGMEDHPREPPATHCGFLLSHVRAAVRTSSNRCQGRSPTVTRQGMDTGHPKRTAREGPDEHMPKVARALADYAVRWDTLLQGSFCAGETDDC